MACCSSPAAAAVAAVGKVGGAMVNRKEKMRRCGRVMCVSSSSPPHSWSSSGLRDRYKMLRIQPGASESEVKKAFRQLALQYHPDVCKGTDCGVQFHRINEAYDIVMASLRMEEEESPAAAVQAWGEDDDPSWDLWEEWMGFEGACTTDYSAHINPYI